MGINCYTKTLWQAELCFRLSPNKKKKKKKNFFDPEMIKNFLKYSFTSGSLFYYFSYSSFQKLSSTLITRIPLFHLLGNRHRFYIRFSVTQLCAYSVTRTMRVFSRNFFYFQYGNSVFPF